MDKSNDDKETDVLKSKIYMILSSNKKCKTIW